MQVHLERPEAENIIHLLESVGDGFQITINEKVYSESLIISPLALEMWNVGKVSDLTEQHFSSLSALNVEVVLLGTGSGIVFPEPQVYRSLVDLGIGVEVMDTPAACRTYNILAGDGRKVAAALIL